MPGLSMNARNGPGSDVIWYHDGSSWGIMGYEVSSGNGIEQPQSQGTVYTSLDYGSTDDGYVKVAIPGDITGYFGSFSWNATYSLKQCKPQLVLCEHEQQPNYVRALNIHRFYLHQPMLRYILLLPLQLRMERLV